MSETSSKPPAPQRAAQRDSLMPMSLMRVAIPLQPGAVAPFGLSLHDRRTHPVNHCRARSHGPRSAVRNAPRFSPLAGAYGTINPEDAREEANR